MSLAKIHKAQLRWSNMPLTPGTFFSQGRVIDDLHEAYPHYVLLATTAAYDAQVEAMARFLNRVQGGHYLWRSLTERDKESWRRSAREALAALGITRPATK